MGLKPEFQARNLRTKFAQNARQPLRTFGLAGAFGSSNINNPLPAKETASESLKEMLDQLQKSPIIPVFYNKNADYACKIVSACHAAGLRFFEFTHRGEAATEVFEALKNHARKNCPGLWLGIGTVYTPDEAERFLGLGADFVVQPVTSAAVGEVCRAAGIPWIPGALTPNEIWAAWQLGATAVKIFPGNAFGPDYLRALRGPMPQVPFLVTGGVEPTSESIAEWLGAGALAVGIGSQLFGAGAVSDFGALAGRLSGLIFKK